MRILVTGGHGFIGSHLVRLLLAEGAAVRCLYRREGVPAALEGLDVEIVRGDLRRRGGLVAAVRGVDEVYHLAGLVSSLSPRAMRATNADGTRRLLDAAEEAGLTGRFVFCSSMAAVGPAGPAGTLTEASPLRPVTAYGASKALAERHVLERSERLPVTILRPPGVYGPGDAEFLRLFRAAAQGFSLVAGRATKRYSLVHAEDLARAFILAARSPEALGQAWLVAHPEVVTLADIIAAAESAVGRRSRRLVLPESFMRLVGTTADLVSQWTGRSSVLGAERMQELVSGDWVCAPGPFQAATGWSPTKDLVTGFAETAAWYRAEGLLR
ncbi:MAG: NAD-dependent epimerase/dehydratase family protein [Planctomycetota bacterium]|nr:NAD-dependent epimerase/dehydratase family protein [Planctomycetota bacterium]